MQKPGLTKPPTRITLYHVTPASNGVPALRRNTSQPYVTWNARVGNEDFGSFSQLFPMRGARTWFIEEGLGRFLEAVRSSPELKEFCHDQIAQMLSGENNLVLVKEFPCRISRAKYDEFNKLFPEFGATTWFVRSMIGAVIQVMDERSLAEYLDSTVQRILTP